MVRSNPTTPRRRAQIKEEAHSGTQARMQVIAEPTKQTPRGFPNVEAPTIKLDDRREKESQ